MKDFDKLAQELEALLPSDKELGYETGAQLRINDPKWREKNAEISKQSLKLAGEAGRQDRINNPEKYQKVYARAAEKRLQNEKWRSNVGKHIRTAETLKKQKIAQGKRVWAEGKIFISRKDAARHYEIDPATFGARMKKFPDQFYYVDKDGNKISKEKYNKVNELVTPNHTYKNISEARLGLNISGDALRLLMRKFPDQYYFLKNGPGKPINHNRVHTPFGEFLNVPKAHEQAINLGLTELTSAYHWFAECSLQDSDNYFKIQPKK
jgi:hypothetical protein